MTQDEILKGNKLIAEFMGAKHDKDTKFPIHPNDLWLPIHGICRHDTIELGKGKTLKYHRSWDWLMPVCMKIREAGYFPFNNFYLDIEELWNVVVKFIEWHNTSTK